MSGDSPAITIRPMAPADLRRVAEIANSLPTAPHWPEAAYAHAIDPRAILRRIALVAENPDGVVAFAIASVIAPQAELETIAVAAEVQRQGIACLLLTRLFAALKTFSVTEVTLEVRASNRSALAFYGSSGFSQTGLRPLYYADPQEDALILGRRLTAP